MTAVFAITVLALLGFAQLIFIAEAKKCFNPIPGVAKMIRGVDITKLDLLPVERFRKIDGFGSPVVKFTCDSGTTRKFPNGQVYEVPDQIWHISSDPGGLISAETELYTTSQELKKSFGVEVGLEATYKKFAFSASTSYTNMQSTITNSSRYISDVGAYFSSNNLELNPNVALPLDDYTKASVDNDLKGTFESNPQAYNKFIDTFGTHFFYNANFGGFIRVVYRTDTKYFASNSEESIKVTAKASYMNLVSASVGVSTSTSKVDENFTKSSSESILYYGGNTNLLEEKKGLAAWQPTVANDPWLFSGKVRPISDLITDPIKKSSMERAVEQYILRNFAAEMDRLISYAKTKSNDAVLKLLEARLKNLINKQVLVSSEIDALGADIDKEIKPPSWFTAHTKLCFKWSAENDANQCGGGAPNDICAKPNSMTQNYFDDTDDRAGGCRMQWGIFSEQQDYWFNDVQLCFKYENTEAGQCQQCNDGIGKTWCMKVNQFTPVYVDSTYNRAGGCRLTWKLIVPMKAPLWMRTARMCYSWSPTWEGTECQGSYRDSCVKADEWTPEFIDKTTNWGGGCKMSWGIKTVLV